MHLLVEAAEAQLALVAGLAHHPLNLKLNVRLVHAHPDQLGHRLRAAAHLLARGGHLLEVPGRLDGAHRAHDLGAVAQLEPRQAAAVVEVRPGRQDVELEPDPRALPHARCGQLGGQGRERAQRLDPLERRLAPGALEHPPHEQARLAVGGHHEVCLLVRAREVGKVGVLDDHRRVQTRSSQPLAQPPHPALDLGCGSHVPYRNRRMILHNGPVYTMDPRLPRVSALAVAGAQIAGGVDVREGEVDTVGHERIDLEGRCVLPGFTDAHVHFLEWSLARLQLDLRGCGSKAEALSRVAGASGEGWLRGRGWEPVRWPDGPPSAADLDAVTGARPAALWSQDGHTLWLNSAALATAPAAAPGGILRETEAFAFPLPDPEPLERSRAVRAGMTEANARGVVAVHDFQRAGGRGLWQRLDADRRLHLRVHMAVPVERLGAATALELRAGFGSELVRVGPVKVFMDGALGLRDGVDAGRLGRCAHERR